jgi:maleylpyruvate isomerase
VRRSSRTGPTARGPARVGGADRRGLGQNGRVPPDDLDHRLDRLRVATDRFTAALAGYRLTTERLREPSGLPGWSRGHVLTHLARNADALRRGVEHAPSGEVVRLYPGGPAGRAADIEAGAGREAAEILADVVHAAEALDKALGAVPDGAWDSPVGHPAGPIPLWRMVTMRWREVEIHRVDLAVGYGPADWPAEFVQSLLPALADPERLAPRLAPGVAVDIEATDSGRVWAVGSGSRTAVRGPCWALTAWLAGRPETVRDVLPDAPALSAWM